MTFLVSNKEPTVFIGNNLATFINHSSLATKITVLVRSILMGAAFVGMGCWYSIPVATILPWAGGVAALTLFMQALAGGYAYNDFRSKE